MSNIDPVYGDVEYLEETPEILTFYKEQPEHTLKTLVCRVYFYSGKEYVALVTRGDRKADFAKLTRDLSLKSIRLAQPDEMKKLNLVIGYVSPIDCRDMKLIVDTAVEKYDAYYDGANSLQGYRKNVNYPRDFKAWKSIDFGQ